MLLASSRPKPIHGALNVSPKFNAARRKGSDLTLIELSGAVEGSRLAGKDSLVLVLDRSGGVASIL
jgi:hypothetical protein